VLSLSIDICFVSIPCVAGYAQADTPLHVAAENGKDTTVALLLDHGADINVKNKDVRAAPTAA
jgi:ankyrin repeat protein